MRSSIRIRLLLSSAAILIILLFLTLEGPVFHGGKTLDSDRFNPTLGVETFFDRLESNYWNRLLATGERSDSFRQIISRVAVPISIVLLVYAALMVLISRSLRRSFVIGLAAAFIIAGIFFSIPSNMQESYVPDKTPLPETELSVPVTAPAVDESPVITYLFSFLILTILLITLILFIRKMTKAMSIERDMALRDIAEETLESIKRGEDYEEAILRCYDKMIESCKEQRGLVRAAAATPEEFRLRLIHDGLASSEITQLTSLFERVRYGRKRLTPYEEEEAELCLKAILTSLEAE